jgi:hypothetical protein
MTPKQTAARARRHLKTIEAAILKMAYEFADVDSYLERRADDLRDLTLNVGSDIGEWLTEMERREREGDDGDPNQSTAA